MALMLSLVKTTVSDIG